MPVNARELQDAFRDLTPQEASRWARRLNAVEGTSRDADDELREFDKAAKGHGVEAITDEDAHVDSYHFNIIAAYVNVGDTYTPTVLWDSGERTFQVTSYGDWVEAYEAAKEDAEGDSDEGDGEKDCGCAEDEGCEICEPDDETDLEEGEED